MGQRCALAVEESTGDMGFGCPHLLSNGECCVYSFVTYWVVGTYYGITIFHGARMLNLIIK